MEKTTSSKLKNDNLLFVLLIASVGLLILQSHLFERDIVNYPRLVYFMGLIPGIIFTGVTKRNSLVKVWEANRSVTLNVLISISSLVPSFFVYGLTSLSLIQLIFGTANLIYAKTNPNEFFVAPITHISHGTSRSHASFQYYFEGRVNSFSGSEEIYGLLRSEEIEKATFEFECRRGLFGSFVITSWDIELNSESKR
jgi:uncharacterized membrane protein